ncbi:MAG: caspase family protein, partial [Verrucomicrobiae bacterium]|nr:caspase family protein [Verrucomicrobiae bacterium]
MTGLRCIALFLVFAGRLVADAPSRVALVIGNARYEQSVGALRNAVNDAKAVSKTLRGLGFTIIEEHNVTRDGLLEAVGDFRGKLAGSDVALFFYAGHGLSVAGSNYLVPIKSGYQPGGDETTRRMLAETKLFNAEQVVAEMSAAGGRCNLVILDACRSTPIARDPSARDVARGPGLVEMTPPAGSLIAFATDAGRTAADGDGANGLYTGELIRHLGTPGLTIEQVFKRTRADVMRLSDGKQVPAEYSRLIGEDIYLAGAGDVTPPEPSAPRATVVKTPSAREINQLASSGRAVDCIEALRLATAATGRGDFAAAPIEALLDLAKEDLKDATEPTPEVETTMQTCRLALDAIRDCLPPDHKQAKHLTAKARNRLGDCLLLTGKPAEALECYNAAIDLTPDDPYPLYNRGRAHLALG